MLEHTFKIMLPSSRNVLQSNLISQNQKLLLTTLVLASNRDNNPQWKQYVLFIDQIQKLTNTAQS
jgi:hypothetical protein